MLLFTTVLFSGLVAGLFYSYSCSVNPGLRALSDSGYLHAMQSINFSIQNPVFFLSFLGLLFLYPASAWNLYSSAPSSSFYLMLAASLCYFIAVFGITIFGNVPLNTLLEQFVINEATETERSEMRRLFERPWNTFHLIRTSASVVSFALSILALIKQKQ